MRRRNARGQATVELALGSLVLVSLFLLAAFLTELQSLGLKVHEAASFAVYDAMGERSMRSRTVPMSDMSRVTGGSFVSPSGRALDRYGDFDGRTTGGGSSMTQIMTRAQGLVVKCERLAAIDNTRLQPYRPIGTYRAAGDFDYKEASNIHQFFLAISTEYQRLVGTFETMYPAEGGVACHAEATIVSAGTRRFLDQGSGAFFKAPLIARSFFTICSPGRARGGVCTASYPMLVGDQSLGANPAGPDHSDCLLASCSNLNYRDMVRALYETNVGDVDTRPRYASQYAASTRGFSPIDENQFFMSFSGEEHGFVDTVPGGNPHNTSGASGEGGKVPTPWNGCWLGVTGC